MKAEKRLYSDVIYHQSPHQDCILNNYTVNIMSLNAKMIFRKVREHDSFKEHYEHIGFNSKYRMEC